MIRFRFSLVAAAALVALSGCGRGSSLGIQSAAPQTSPVPPDCPVVGEGGYEIALSQTSGSPGTRIQASGPTPLYGKDGSYRGPSGEIQLWWNADPQKWESVLPGGAEPISEQPGDVLLIGSARLSDCTFRIEFEVPDAPPGEYTIVPVNFAWEDKENFSAALFGASPTDFTVE